MIVDAGGTVGGVGDLLVANPLILRSLTASASGTAATSSSLGEILAFSGLVEGIGTLAEVPLSAAGTAAGTGTITGNAVRWVLLYGASIGGSGSVYDAGVPLPLLGTSTLVGYAEVDHLPPLCPCPPPPSITLRWQQRIQKADLPLYLRTESGGRYAPFSVNFTLFQIYDTGAEHQVGPELRTPVMADLGDYYATGIAGEVGQPGDWAILWQWQIYENGPTYSQKYPFRVEDAFLADEPTDLTPRQCKWGWEE